jgi:hypothetical protein
MVGGDAVALTVPEAQLSSEIAGSDLSSQRLMDRPAFLQGGRYVVARLVPTRRRALVPGLIEKSSR